MTFFGLSPLVLAGLVAAAAAGLFLLHHLRIRPEVLRVPTLLFWREAVEETRARSLFGSFRHPRTYAFLTALAALLALSLAEPETRNTQAEVRHHVLLLDLSPAMGARLEGRGSQRTQAERILDLARTSALDYLDAVSLRDRIAVLTPGNEAGLVGGFSEVRDVLKRRVAALEPAPVPGDLARALHRAAALCRGKTRPRVVVLTGPGQPSSLDIQEGKIVPSGVPVQVVRHGRAGPDQGLVGVRYAETLEVRVASGRVTAGRTLTVTTGERGNLVPPVKCPALGDGTGAWIRIPGVEATGETVRVSLEPPDSFPHNDSLHYRLPLKQVRGVFLEPALARTAALLVAADPFLEPVKTPAEAALVLAAGRVVAEPLAVGIRPRPVRNSIPGDGCGEALLPPLYPGIRPLVPVAGARLVLVAGEAHLARVVPGEPPRLEMAPGLLHPDGSFTRSLAGAAFLARTWERLAGNRDGAVALPEGEPMAFYLEGDVRVRVGSSARSLAVGEGSLAGLEGLEPGLGVLEAGNESRSVAVHPAGILASAADAGPGKPAEPPTAPLRIWEWLVLLALGLVLIDGWLHLKGRIP